ncbi:MAG: hypothetical protein AAGJ80_08255, partial [Cyanobacteria bacterium J06553_1]
MGKSYAYHTSSGIKADDNAYAAGPRSSEMINCLPEKLPQMDGPRAEDYKRDNYLEIGDGAAATTTGNRSELVSREWEFTKANNAYLCESLPNDVYRTVDSNLSKFNICNDNLVSNLNEQPVATKNEKTKCSMIKSGSVPTLRPEASSITRNMSPPAAVSDREKIKKGEFLPVNGSEPGISPQANPTSQIIRPPLANCEGKLDEDDEVQHENSLSSNIAQYYTMSNIPEKGHSNEVIINHDKQGIHVEKNKSLRHSHVGIPHEILSPPSLHFKNESCDYEKDRATMLKNSDKRLETFLKLLFDTFSQTYSKSRHDLGAFLNPNYVMKIRLKSGGEANLPRHKPYSCHPHQRKATERILNQWLRSGLIEYSNERGHASRLLCVRKHLNNSSYEEIVKRLKIDNNITLDPLDQSSLFKIDPDLLTDIEIDKC